MDFTIDSEIESLLQPLSADEYQGLKDAIATDGHIDPLVVLVIGRQRLLGDGHHRLKVSKELRIKPPIREVKLPTRDLAIQWVIDNQLGRRNLTSERRAYYIGKEYLSKKQEQGGDRKSEESSGQNDQLIGDTSSALSQKHGVSPKTVRRDAEFAEAVDAIGAVDPKAKETILSGESNQTKTEVIASAPVLCDRCRRVGATADCKACEEAKKAKTNKPKKPKKPKDTREPGDDTEVELSDAKANRDAKRANGKPKFDDRIIGKLIGQLVRAFDQRGNAIGKSPEHSHCVSALNAVLQRWHQWQQKTT